MSFPDEVESVRSYEETETGAGVKERSIEPQPAERVQGTAAQKTQTEGRGV